MSDPSKPLTPISEATYACSNHQLESTDVTPMSLINFSAIASHSQKPWRKMSLREGSVETPGDLATAQNRCDAVLGSTAAWENVEGSDSVLLSGFVGGGIASSGTQVRIRLTPSDTGTRAEVSAWPGAQLFDWGVSKRLVAKILGQLTA